MTHMTTKENFLGCAKQDGGEQENSPEEELDEMEASNLSNREFREMIIMILNSTKKDIEIIKKNQSVIRMQYLKYIIHWKE